MSDIEVVRRIYDAMHARDFDALFELVAESIVITQDDRLPWGGRFEGHDGFAQFGRTKGTTRASGTEFDIAEMHRWTIRDGKAVTAHFSIDTPSMLEALAGS